jgi:hypothetical protein
VEPPQEVLDHVLAGHQLEHDPPAAMTRVRRWTCKRCGDAVLLNGSIAYGGATIRTCEESQRYWSVM